MRRPPDSRLLGFLEAYDRPIADLALALREIILEEVPDASEWIYQVYTVAIWFGFSGKMKDMFCYIATNGGTSISAFRAARRFRIRMECWRAKGRLCGTSNSRVSGIWSGPLCAVTSARPSSSWARPRRQGEPLKAS